jgi:hypothetical protein
LSADNETCNKKLDPKYVDHTSSGFKYCPVCRPPNGKKTNKAMRKTAAVPKPRPHREARGAAQPLPETEPGAAAANVPEAVAGTSGSGTAQAAVGAGLDEQEVAAVVRNFDEDTDLEDEEEATVPIIPPKTSARKGSKRMVRRDLFV